MTIRPVVIIGGIPVDTPTNRAYATQRGLGHFAWPQHREGSVIMECRKCGGLVWVGPDAQGAHSRVIDAHVMCMLCVLIDTQGDIPIIVRLSGHGR